MKHTLSILVENKPGVLTRVAGLFARRGFNIESLAVGLSEDPKFSRMTIVIDGDEHPVDQVTKQLHKLINVLKIRDLDPDNQVSAELLQPLGVLEVVRTGTVALGRGRGN